MAFSIRLLLLATCLIGACGCGLSDYQKRMDEQRERVEKFDQLNRLLDDPIETPMVPVDSKDGGPKEARAWPFEPFLRLPKGYTANPKDKLPFYNFLFHYKGGSEGAHGIFVAAALVADSKQKEKKQRGPGEYSSDEFRGFIKPALEDFCLKTFKIQVSLREKTKPEGRTFKPLVPYPDAFGVVKLQFTYYTLGDETHKDFKDFVFDVYHHERGDRQTCIAVFRSLQMNTTAFKNAMDACLSSLEITAEAGNRRTEYRKAMGRN